MDRVMVISALIAAVLIAAIVAASLSGPPAELAIHTIAPAVDHDHAAGTPLADCRATNRQLAGYLTGQTRTLIERDQEIRRLRAELAAAREQARGLAL